MKIFIRAILFLPLYFICSTFVFATEYQLSPSDDWFSFISGNDLQPGDEVILA